MVVIISDMDMPRSCADCPMCHPKGKDEPWNYCCFATMDDINIEEWDKERYITCSLKEVPTGKWIPQTKDMQVWKCSVCGNGVCISEKYLHIHHKYCGQCGSVMEK